MLLRQFWHWNIVWLLPGAFLDATKSKKHAKRKSPPGGGSFLALFLCGCFFGGAKSTGKLIGIEPIFQEHKPAQDDVPEQQQTEAINCIYISS